MKKRIMENLQAKLDYLYSLGYNKERILGIFLYGSQNYGTSTEESDIDAKIIILPSFKDLCCKKDWYSKEIIQENGEHIIVKDIRDYMWNVKKQNINFLEILFTEYKIVNERYEKIWNEYFIDNREKFARYDAGRAVTSILGQAHHTLKQSEEGKDSKKLYNVKRLCGFLKNYIDGVPYEDCLHPSNIEELLRIKSGLSSEEKDKLYLELFSTLSWFQTMDSNPDYKVGELMDNALIKMLEFSFTAEPKPNVLDILTNAETRAYEHLKAEVGVEGYVSISALVEKTGVSRPTYNNLLSKLKNKGYAEVINKGVKGTYIRFI